MAGKQRKSAAKAPGRQPGPAGAGVPKRVPKRAPGQASRKASSLGERVRRLRGERGLTLTQLSERSGISVGTLSKLENGLTGLNLDNVIRLASGFGMPVAMLLNESGEASGACSVSRRGGAFFHTARELDFHVLHNDLPAQSNIFWKVRIKTRTMAEFGAFHSHPGEEFFYVLSGTVTFLMRGRKPMRLKTGDSVQFDSALDHAYLSVGREDAMILMSNTIADARPPGYLELAAAASQAHAAGKPRARARRQSAAKGIPDAGRKRSRAAAGRKRG